jgi:hypothetical protein
MFTYIEIRYFGIGEEFRLKKNYLLPTWSLFINRFYRIVDAKLVLVL